jgi:hypothetical protein
VPPLFPMAVLTVRRVHDASGRRSSPPHVGWPPVITALNVTEEATAHSAFPLPPFGHAPHCSAPHRPPLRPPSPITNEAAPSCPTRPKGVSRHRAPPAPRACPQHRLAKPGHRISPAVIFPHEQLTARQRSLIVPPPH